MPVLDGYEAARQIRAAQGPAVKLLALSANVFAENQQRATAAGVDAFLAKPFQESALLEHVQRLTGVEYVDETVPAPEPELPPNAVSGGLSAELTQAIRFAAREADYGRLLSLLKEVEACDRALADRLGSQIRRFDYQGLDTLLAQLETRRARSN